MRIYFIFILVSSCLSCHAQVIFGGGSQIDDCISIVSWYRVNSCLSAPDSLLFLNNDRWDNYNIEVELSKVKSELLISFKNQIVFRQLTKNRKFTIQINKTTISGRLGRNKRIQRMKVDYGDGMIVHISLNGETYRLTHESSNDIDYSQTAEIYKANVESYVRYYSQFILFPLKFCE